jgi:hypothetical protein
MRPSPRTIAVPPEPVNCRVVLTAPALVRRPVRFSGGMVCRSYRQVMQSLLPRPGGEPARPCHPAETASSSARFVAIGSDEIQDGDLRRAVDPHAQRQ